MLQEHATRACWPEDKHIYLKETKGKMKIWRAYGKNSHELYNPTYEDQLSEDWKVCG